MYIVLNTMPNTEKDSGVLLNVHFPEQVIYFSIEAALLGSTAMCPVNAPD